MVQLLSEADVSAVAGERIVAPQLSTNNEWA